MRPPDDFDVLGRIFRAHPWHGVPIGREAPQIVTCYIEIVPTDTVKYELDKGTGMIKVDRPQKYSNTCPALYGLIPQTYCRGRVGARCAEMSGHKGIEGDGDPLDICIFAERPIARGDILLRAKPIGGFRMIDRGEADDKIIAVQIDDPTYGKLEDISQCPKALIDRLGHYFLTYKEFPGPQPRQVELDGTYSCDEAHRVIQLAQLDYQDHFGGVHDWATQLHASLMKMPGEKV